MNGKALRVAGWCMMIVRLCFVFIAVESGTVVGLSYGVIESIAILQAFLNDRRAAVRDVRGVAWVMPFAYLIGGLMLPVSAPAGDRPGDALAALLVLGFYGLGVWGRLLQWDGFTVGAATWLRLTDRGPFRWVRHPEYAAQVAARAVMLAAWPSAWNAGICAGFVLAMAAAVVVEEGFLKQFPAWCGYAARVRWRMVPGVW